MLDSTEEKQECIVTHVLWCRIVAFQSLPDQRNLWKLIFQFIQDSTQTNEWRQSQFVVVELVQLRLACLKVLNSRREIRTSHAVPLVELTVDVAELVLDFDPLVDFEKQAVSLSCPIHTIESDGNQGASLGLERLGHPTCGAGGPQSPCGARWI